MSQFSPSFTFGTSGLPAPILNRITAASEYVYDNQQAIELLKQAKFAGVGQVLMQVVSSTLLAPNRYTYTLKLVQPDASGTAIVDVTTTELLSVTGWNMAEFGNTAGVAGGGVNATRANSAGFALLPVPDGAIVWAISVTNSAGLNITLFERLNAYDGECSVPLLEYIDGGTYGAS